MGVASWTDRQTAEDLFNECRPVLAKAILNNYPVEFFMIIEVKIVIGHKSIKDD